MCVCMLHVSKLLLGTLTNAFFHFISMAWNLIIYSPMNDIWIVPNLINLLQTSCTGPFLGQDTYFYFSLIDTLMWNHFVI